MSLEKYVPLPTYLIFTKYFITYLPFILLDFQSKSHACIHYAIFLLYFSCRRLLHDDSRGVGEVLNETVCALSKCEGLTVSIFFALF